MIDFQKLKEFYNIADYLIKLKPDVTPLFVPKVLVWGIISFFISYIFFKIFKKANVLEELNGLIFVFLFLGLFVLFWGLG